MPKITRPFVSHAKITTIRAFVRQINIQIPVQLINLSILAVLLLLFRVIIVGSVIIVIILRLVLRLIFLFLLLLMVALVRILGVLSVLDGLNVLNGLFLRLFLFLHVACRIRRRLTAVIRIPRVPNVTTVTAVTAVSFFLMTTAFATALRRLVGVLSVVLGLNFLFFFHFISA